MRLFRLFNLLPDRGVSAVTLCAVVLILISGCGMSSFTNSKLTKKLNPAHMFSDEVELPDPEIPTRLVSTWTDTILSEPGKTPQRGFGGRISFFNQKSDVPVRVEGQLVVYAYDESGRQAHETQPTRRYVFPQELFARHESMSEIGPSYSVWLPWDDAGGEQKKISLITRFEPVGGALIAGEQTKHLLPGTVASEEQPVKPIDMVRLAQHTQVPGKAEAKPLSATQKSSGEPQQSTSTSKAVTIPLSKNWQKRLSLPTEVAK